MPVGTQATVKALASADLEALGRADHPRQHLPPGAAAGRGAGRGARRPAPVHGLAAARSSPTRAASRSSAWPRRRSVDEDGVTFRSHLDGSAQRFTPERAMAVQAALGSDIAMAFDECPPSDAPPRGGRRRRWRAPRAGRGAAWRRPARPGSCASASCRAGVDVGLRRAHLAEIARAAVRRPGAGRPGRGRAAAGDARGGRPRSPRDARRSPALPDGRGHARKICWPASRAGIDMFDCVMPTRNARNGQLFVRAGQAEHRQQRPPRGRRARSRTGAPARPAGSTAAPTWPTCSAPRSCCIPPGDHPQPAALPGSGPAGARGDLRAALPRSWPSARAAGRSAAGDRARAIPIRPDLPGGAFRRHCWLGYIW